MPVVKMSISLDDRIAETLKLRARERNQPASRYLAELIEADAKRATDELAEEGYRLLSEEGRKFAELALPLAREWWPEWTEAETGDEPDTAEG